MAEQNKTALLFGATGLIGSFLCTELAQNPHVDKVKIFVRRPVLQSHPKVEMIVFDYTNWHEIEHYFTEEVLVFCAVGTTKSQTPDREVYRNIDYEIPLMLATICTHTPALALLIVSSLGANPESGNFYLRTKGEMEKAVQNTGIKKVHFFRPALLLGRRKEQRLGEKFFTGLDFILRPFLIGKLRRYRGIQAKTVAQSMVTVALGKTVQTVFESEEIAGMKS